MLSNCFIGIGDALKDSELLTELKDLVDNYLTTHPRQSLYSLADKCGVSDTTLRRTYQKKSVPNATNMIKLISILVKGNSSLEIIKNSPECIREKLEESFPVIAGSEYFLGNRNVLEALNMSDNTFIIFCLASNHCGIREKTILARLGSIAKKDIIRLKDKGVIFEENDVLKSCFHGFSFPLAFGKKQIPNYLKFYTPDRPGGYGHQETQALSKEAHKKLFNMHKEFHEEVAEFMRNENNHGDEPFFSVSFFDSFMRSFDDEDCYE